MRMDRELDILVKEEEETSVVASEAGLLLERTRN
jgi:hypothetical protein